MSGTFSQKTESHSVTIFSIGHSNQSMEAFIELLKKHNVQVLIDVRSHPYSRYVPHFNSQELAHAARHVNIQYLFMGKELGGRPDGEEFYDDEDHLMHNPVADSPLFIKGIIRLEEIGEASRLAIMGSKEYPTTCHRHPLIGRVLAHRGMNLHHIRSDGHIQTEEELTSLEEAPSYEQGSFWDEQTPDRKDREARKWRSIRPVLRRRQQPNSSDH